MHAPHLSKDLVGIHVWRQTITQTNIDNFYQHDINIFNPRRNFLKNDTDILRMEFPIMQWLIANIYFLTGQKIIVTRLFMLFISLLSIYGMYFLLQELFKSHLLSAIGAWSLCFSPAFFYYAINPLPDVMALGASIWGLALFFRWLNNQNNWALLGSGLVLSIAALAKLPFIIFFIVPLAFLIKNKLVKGQVKDAFIKGLLAFSPAISPVIWYAFVISGWSDNMVVKGILANDVSFGTLLSYINHHLFSSMPEFFINYAAVPLFLAGIYFFFKNKSYRSTSFGLFLSLLIIILFYFTFEINAIGKVHDYYLFPIIPILFITLSYGAYHLLQLKTKWIKGLTVIAFLALPITCFLRTKNSWNVEKPGFNADLYRYRNELRELTPENALVVAGNDQTTAIFLYYIRKKGWIFCDENLPPHMLEEFRDKGAKYLYTDSEEIATEVTELTKKKLGEFGSIQVFELKDN